MKKTKFLLPCAICAVVVMLVASCSKDGAKGDTGPAGPPGSAGAAGAAGVAGPAGTANVIYSAWLDVTYTPDTVHNGLVVDTVAWEANITATKLDNTILNTGEVKVYVNANVPSAPAIFPLPFVDVYQLFGVTSITPLFTVGNIGLLATEDAGTFTVPSGPSAGLKAWQYRYVLIPGGTTAKAYKTINWNNYNEVKAYLGLKD